jgi:hypothetical protein
MIAAHSEESGQGAAEIDKVDWLGDIVTEAGRDAFLLNVGHDVGREGDDGHLGEFSLHLPVSDLSTGLVTIFTRHVKIALHAMLVMHRQHYECKAKPTNIRE